jgi:hypothetical protein
MQILKHVGRHNDKRIVLAFRQVPGDEHMCLVIYSDTLPQLLHDEVMQCLESPVGQAAEELSDALFRVTMKDGRNCLDTLHRSGFLKKVATNQVIITPNAKSNVRLDELNTILNEMKTGEEAVRRLADLDKNKGLTTRKKEAKEVGANPASRTAVADVSTYATIEEVLTDDQLASQRIAQAAKMKLEAQQLLAEAERLEKEAASFDKVVSSDGKKPKKTSKKQTA